MGVHVLQGVSQWAGAAALLACIGCLIAAALGLEMSASVFLPGEAAYDLARTMAVLGGTCVLVSASTATLYYWLVGVASGRATAFVEIGLVSATLIFGGAVGMLRERRRLRPSR